MRGEEILSGAQRIHDPDMLTERAKHHALGKHAMLLEINLRCLLHFLLAIIMSSCTSY